MSGIVVQFNQPTEPDKLIKLLAARDNTKELFVLRVYADENGERQLEWFSTEAESKVWAVGALHLLAHKILESD